jgi:hypothetical protein
MTKRSKMMRVIALVALGGSTFVFGVFGPSGLFGCNYAGYNDYATAWTSAGQAAIQIAANNLDFGADLNAIVRDPSITFAQSTWANFVDRSVPDDLPTNSVVLR